MVNLSFALNVTGAYRLRCLAGKTEGAERTGRWTPFINAHMCADDASTATTWMGGTALQKIVERLEQKQVSIKRFLERNLPHVEMSQCMNALVDKVHKQEVPCTVICTP